MAESVPGPKRRRSLPPLVLLVPVLAAGCAGHSSLSPEARAVLEIHTTARPAVLHVEVARSPAQLARGLMGRSRLSPDAGMAFVFDGSTDAAFWMKDTTIPLSIAFWDRAGRIVDIEDMAPCRGSPCVRYRSSKPYVGAVEANRGYFTRHGVRIGDRVSLS